MLKLKSTLLVLLFAVISSNSVMAQFDPGNEPLPLAFAVTGSGSYCIGSGGLAVGLDNSEIGVNYTLYKNAIAMTPTVSGTGSAITFGNQLNGIYTVSGINAFGSMVMTGNAVIVENPLTALISQSTVTQTMVVGGLFSPISVNATGTNLTYQWYNNTTAGVSGGTNLAAANGAQTNTYTPQSGTVGTTYYYCIVSGSCASVVSTISGAFIVKPDVKQLTLKVFLQGLYNSTNNNLNKTMNFVSNALVSKFTGTIADTITLELHSSSAYGTIVYKAIAIELHQDGTCNSPGVSYISIPSAYSGNYYITIKSRNHVLTTTAAPVVFSSGSINYDFTNAATKAYGSNMKLIKSGVYAIYSGDTNLDGLVTAIGDRSPTQSKIIAASKGYVIQDVNGDGYVTAIGDRSLIQINVIAGVRKKDPLNP